MNFIQKLLILSAYGIYCYNIPYIYFSILNIPIAHDIDKNYVKTRCLIDSHYITNDTYDYSDHTWSCYTGYVHVMYNTSSGVSNYTMKVTDTHDDRSRVKSILKNDYAINRYIPCYYLVLPGYQTVQLGMTIWDMYKENGLYAILVLQLMLILKLMFSPEISNVLLTLMLYLLYAILTY